MRHENVFSIATEQDKREKVYFSDIYNSETGKTGSKRGLRKDAPNESNMSMVLEGLNDPRTANKSSKNLHKKAKLMNFGSGINSGQARTKKKKKKEAPNVQVPKELLSCLLDTLLHSQLEIAQPTYRKLLRLLFEGLDLVETKSKNLFSNRNLVVNYLELLLKLLVRRSVSIRNAQNVSLFGRPSIFPLKLKLSKPANQKKSVLAKLERKLSLRTKNALFNNKRHLNQVLLVFRRIAQKAQNFLGFDVEETVQKMIQEKQFQSQSKRGNTDQALPPAIQIFESKPRQSSRPKMQDDTHDTVNPKTQLQESQASRRQPSLKRNKSASSIMSASKGLGKSRESSCQKEKRRLESSKARNNRSKSRKNSLKASMSSAVIKVNVSEKEFRRPPRLKKVKKKKNQKFKK